MTITGSSDQVEAFKHGERFIYGITFHPEVRNKWIVDRFVKLGYEHVEKIFN